jgi:alpha-glucuronidase
VDQYNEPLASLYNSLETCPETLLLWFHHVPWDYRMESGLSLWEELQRHYDQGAEQVRQYREIWAGMKPFVSARRHAQVSALLKKNEQDAIRWRDVCLDYFRTFAEQNEK